nr:ImmA/IrrE family metallo-endopeptidase [Anabaena lutea]
MELENIPPRWPFEATCAADALEIRVVWDTIPSDNQGLIVARIEPLKRKITLNENIPNRSKGFEESTIAHELGHWMLHINQDEADGLTEQLELNLGIEDARKLFLCRTSETKINNANVQNNLDKIEWQAQYFASCLLMPRQILQAKRKGRDLTNWKHLYAMKDELGVTISNLTNRLQDLGLIYIPKGSKQIYPGKAVPNGQTSLLNKQSATYSTTLN